MKQKTSYIINFILLLFIAFAFLFEYDGLPHKIFLSLGLFGLSGSLTNSLAIHMLFERIPFVYGSGIIALNFQEIKRDLEELMIRQFFNREQIKRFVTDELQAGVPDLAKQLPQFSNLIDFDLLFDKLKSSLAESFKDNPLIQMALPLLEINRERMIEAVRNTINAELQNPELKEKFQNLLTQNLQTPHEEFEQRVRTLIGQRLAELTPQAVKEIIHHMMETKLVWLVIWGAIIGALMGVMTALLRFYFNF